ncbi:MAG TPA: bifunctional metallophosphatase/5'-nucleotidase [Actinomycetota bacterium]|nr:bifunctional metallophosphatase/5'-nucleotidase [Actinomycetota bacterium]
MTLVKVRERLALAAAVLLLAATAVAVLPGDEGVAQPVAEKSKVSFWLTIAHNNDGESQLINAGAGSEEYGGVARFASVVKRAEEEALARRHGGFILLNAGDNFLAGPEFNESLQKGVPFYDSIALNRMDFDAMGIGNHEFDFGPDVFAQFIKGFDPDVPFVSANLNVKDEPKLARLANKGRIVKRVVVEEQGRLIGVVGATTPLLPAISSPRNVTVRNVAKSVQKQIDKLTAMGVDIIITVSQLQSIDEDIALGPELTGVDIMISGGGNELLADPAKDLLIPGDEAAVFGPYPMWTTDADGRDVPVVTTSGDYRYLGQLVAGFNDRGRLLTVRDPVSGPVRVSSLLNPDGVKPASYIQKNVVVPLEAAIADAAANIVATSEVDLNGLREPGVRTQETNEGNLIADALLWKATELAPSFGMDPPDIALQNGGGIRNNSVIPAGNISELDVFGMVPFANFVSIVPSVTPQTLKDILENAVSALPTADGRFAQIAGFEFTYDINGTAQVIDIDTGEITTPGTRIVDVTLDDGTPIIDNGAVAAGAPDVDVATIDFLARGGDQYPFGDVPFTTLGTTYFQAVLDYLVDELAGEITAADYPEGGEGRITET